MDIISENQVNEDVIKEVSKAIAKESYDDLLKPTFSACGSIISLPFRLIDASLSGVKEWIDKRNFNYEKTRKLLALKMLKVDESKIVQPDSYVAVPALQYLAYSYDSDELRDMYANLLASSMNIDLKYQVHPAFVEIIKQLCPDEAKLLNWLKDRDDQEVIDIHLEERDKNQYVIILVNFTDIADNICDCSQNISSYIENLERLKIIQIISDSIASDDGYNRLFNHKLIQELRIEYETNEKKIKMIKKALCITSFGKTFINVCL